MNPRPRGTYGPGTIYSGGSTSRGPFHELVYTDLSGRRRRKRFYGTKRAATLELSRIVTERDLILDGRGGDYTPKMPFEELVRRYMEEMGARVGTAHAKATKRALLLMQEKLGLRLVSDVRLEALMAYRQRRLGEKPQPANRTINLELGCLRSLMNWAVQVSLLKTSPLAGYRQLPQGRGHKGKSRALSEDQIAKLLDAVRSLDAAQPKRFPFELTVLGMLLTGARYGALRQLTRASWSPSERLLTIADETTKTGQGRQLKADAGQGGGLHRLVPAALEAGARVTGRLPRPNDPIWLWNYGKRLGSETGAVNAELYKAMEIAGIPRVTPDGKFSVHAFRHTYVTRCARFGVPENRAAYWVGHSSVAMTRGIYTHIQAADLQIAATGILPEFSASYLPATPTNRTLSEEA